MERKKCAGCRKSSCNGCRLFLEMKLHTDKDNMHRSTLKTAGEEQNVLGIAYDVGTTTIAAGLWNLETGECIGTASCVNLQRNWGSDVVSRIAYCMENEAEHVRQLQIVVTEAMDRLAGKLIKDYKVTDSVKRVVVAGNTAMCELVMGSSVQGLAKAPFRKGYTGCVEKTGEELGFLSLKKAKVLILPAMEGYVGADALAVYTYVRSLGAGANSLIVDVGTNGEILLMGKNKLYACSTAAGPALEGAAVCHGMLALSGAIASVRMVGCFPGEDIFCEVIGDKKPIGICGSGLLDVLALLYRLGVVDKSGYLKSRREAAKDGVGVRICRRIDTVDGENRFCLTEGKEPVFLTGGDIRQLQLAKSAIRAGIEILLQKEKLTAGELDRLYLAGAFGNYIRPESAVGIGLLPDIPKEKIVPVGNGAGLGAAMALLSPETVKEMLVVSEEAEHVGLAEEASFEELFLHYINLP